MPTESKKMKIFMILGLAAGAFLIILSLMAPREPPNRTPVREGSLSHIDSDTFIRQQEEKITEILKRIDGVRDPFVMITLETSVENRYAQRQNIRESSRGGEITQRDISKDIIFYGDDKQPILIKEIMPRIRGVAVVGGGMSRAETQLQIINLVSTVLNVPTNRVYVISAD